MLVVFLLDTSASMNQKISNGLALLDCAKSSIEHFCKIRQRDAASRTDRYMLVTSEDGPGAIKVLDKFPFINFLRVLKGTNARDLMPVGAAVQLTFNFLHLQRLATDVDHFGHGRNPCSIDPTLVLVLSDGTPFTSPAGITEQLALPGGPPPLGSDLTLQPFRWDQRVFATILRIPAVSSAPPETAAPLPPPGGPISGGQSQHSLDVNVSAFCEVTGGKCVVVTSWRMLMQHMELVALRLQSCVVISFEQMPLPGTAPPPPSVVLACQRKLLFVRAGTHGQAQPQGHWPLPEAFWPGSTQQSGLPPREAHPCIAYKAVDADPYIPASFVFDKYEVEGNPVLQFLGKASAGVCWQVFLRGSKGSNHGFGDPFGYLRLNRVGNTLTLIVLPYNYPVLWGLLDQLTRGPNQPKAAPTPTWRQEMERYCAGVPAYYAAPLRSALKRWGLASNVVPESMSNVLSLSSAGVPLKRLRMLAKVEADRHIAALMKNEQQNDRAVGAAAGQGGAGFPPLESRSVRLIPPPPYAFVKGSPAKAGTTAPAAASGQSAGAGDAPGSAVAAPPARGAGTFRDSLEALLPGGPTVSASSAGTGAGPQPAGGEGPPAAAAPAVPSSKEAKIFSNPFDICREDIMRKVRQLPLLVAVALESRKGQTQGSRDKGPHHSHLVVLAGQLAAAQEAEARHSVPIEKMGDFNEALLRQQPPRNPYADEAERTKQAQRMFGNPYRQEKTGEGANEAWMEGSAGPFSRGRKRRRRSESPSPPPSQAQPEASLRGSTGQNMFQDGALEAALVQARRILAVEGGEEGDGGQDQDQDQESQFQGPGTLSPDSTESLPPGFGESSPMDWEEIAGTAVEDRPGGNGQEPVQAEREAFVPLTTEDAMNEVDGNGSGETAAAVAAQPLAEGTSATLPHGTWRALAVSKAPTGKWTSMRGLQVADPKGVMRDQEAAVTFVLSVFRALRAVRGKDTEQLFELLAEVDFPVERDNLVQQLIVQAQRLKKGAVAQDLMKRFCKPVVA